MGVDRSFNIQYPEGWVPVDSPGGAVALVIAPEVTNGFHSNLVVTFVELPIQMVRPHTDRYLWEAIAGLERALTQPSISAVWITEPADLQRQQRLIVHHEVEGIDVELIQHHTWLDDAIVVTSVSMAREANHEDDLIALLDVCLLSFATNKLAAFTDWKPLDVSSPWSPSPDAHRIAHL